MMRRKLNTQKIGQAAEKFACEYLLRQGLILITRNYHSKLGEIDLIMRDQTYLVFVEVRFRHGNAFGSSSESVTYHKQHKLLRTAQLYLQAHHLADKLPCRFDVVALTATAGQPTIEWIKDAFSA